MIAAFVNYLSVFFGFDEILKVFDIYAKILGLLKMPMLFSFQVKHHVVIDGFKQAMNYWVPRSPYWVIPFSFRHLTYLPTILWASLNNIETSIEVHPAVFQPIITTIYSAGNLLYGGILIT